MRKATQDLAKKAVKDLQKELMQLREEIAKASLERKVNVQKDTNIISKKKKRIAVLLTVINQKKEEQKLQDKTV